VDYFPPSVQLLHTSPLKTHGSLDTHIHTQQQQTTDAVRLYLHTLQVVPPQPPLPREQTARQVLRQAIDGCNFTNPVSILLKQPAANYLLTITATNVHVDTGSNTARSSLTGYNYDNSNSYVYARITQK